MLLLLHLLASKSFLLHDNPLDIISEWLLWVMWFKLPQCHDRWGKQAQTKVDNNCIPWVRKA